MSDRRVTAGQFTLILPPNGRATLLEADAGGVDHECPWGVGHFEALVQFAGEVVRLHAMLESMRESRSPIPTSPHNTKLLVGLRAYATDWRDRAASKDIVEEAIGEIERLHLWMEFIQHNSTSPDAREYAGEALKGEYVPEGYDWDERGVMMAAPDTRPPCWQDGSCPSAVRCYLANRCLQEKVETHG